MRAFEDIQKAYFIGIGGIGMSAVARFFNQNGIEVHGYDKVQSPLTDELEAEGMKVHYEDNTDYIPEGIDIVVYTPAVKQLGELDWFRARNYPIHKRAEVLGIISRSRKTIGVAGTHGKTTTSSILTHLLKVGGVDCTAFLGGIALDFEGNYVAGTSDWVVVEADEFDRSFLQLSPQLEIITSMDADHLDIYGDEAGFLEGFHSYIRKVKKGGKVFYKEDLAIDKTAVKEVETQLKAGSFGIEKGKHQAQNIRVEAGYFVFDYEDGKGRIDDIKFTLPGRHNVLNAIAAIAICREIGVKAAAIKKALATFKGIKRRFEFVVRRNDWVYIDDYAHHPLELKAAIGAAKELFPEKKITGIFQPHLYTRTRDFVDGFAEALDELDETLLMDIYPAREQAIPGVTSEIIFMKMKNPNKTLVNKDNLLEVLKTRDTEVLMTLGAGDIGRFVEKIKLLN